MPETLIGTLSYDGQGRRITKVASNSGDWGMEHSYYHSGQQVLEERRRYLTDANMNTTAQVPGGLRRYMAHPL